MKKCRAMTVGASVAGVCLMTLVGGAATADAAPIAITCQSVGALPAADFGGSGIPNSSVCQSTFVDGSNTITIGIQAHERFENDVVTNDGAGTYFADAGANFGDPTFATAPSASLGSTWNTGIYVNVAGGGTLSDYEVSFLYEVDPAAANDRPNFGSVDINFFAGNATTYQDSQNLNFAFFCTGAPPVVIPPPGGCFDPLVGGVYSAAIDIRKAGALIGEVSNQVNVASVPEPVSILLLGSGVLGLMARRRVNRSNA